MKDNMFVEGDFYKYIDPNKETAHAIFSCAYCNTDIILEGLIRRGHFYCNLDCAIKDALKGEE